MTSHVLGSRLRRLARGTVAGQVLEGMRDGLAIHDGTGRLVGWNRAAGEITGWSREEAAFHLARTLPEGLVDLGGGRWVELRRIPMRRRGRTLSATLFTDARQQVALRDAYARLNELATSDPLTGLPNRLLAEDRLGLSVELARRDGRAMALLFVDLDRFKLVNDTLGHAAGDELLCEVARRLRRSTRESDTAARLGGDEFVVILHTIASPCDAERVACHVLHGMRAPFRIAGQEVYVGCSIGVAGFPQHAEDPDTVLRHADLAMYQAKADGGNGVRVYTPALSSGGAERLVLDAHLRRAIPRGELEVHYQPQIDIDTGQVAGVEALVRWRHPSRGLVMPDVFLPIAEQDGLIVDIDRAVLLAACGQARRWHDERVGPPILAVNLSARTITTQDAVAIVDEAIKETGFDPRRLEIEISEHVVATADRGVDDKLAGLRDLGVQIAIDDFGTGYSSLSQLKRYPLDTIKLDRSFVADVTAQPDPADIAVLRAVLALADDLDLRCVAEGVETPAQRKVLRFLRCHLVQGFLYGSPTPAGELEPILSLDRAPALMPTP